MYEFEFEKPQSHSCPCCGAPQTVLTRFVYQGGNAYAVYKAWLSHGSHNRVAELLVVLGSWGDDAIQDRAEFCAQLWSDDDNWNVSVVDPDFSSSHTGKLGKPLDRESALRHPWLQDVFDLSDEIVRVDEALIDYFRDKPSLN